MKKASRENKKKTLLSNCKITANRYKSTISQANNHQVKFKLTQEKIWNDSFDHTSTTSNDIYDKLH